MEKWEWLTALIAPPLDRFVLIDSHKQTHIIAAEAISVTSGASAGVRPAHDPPRPGLNTAPPGLTWSSESGGKEIKTASLKTHTMSATDENVKKKIKPYSSLVVLAKAQTQPKRWELNALRDPNPCKHDTNTKQYWFSKAECPSKRPSAHFSTRAISWELQKDFVLQYCVGNIATRKHKSSSSFIGRINSLWLFNLMSH